MQRCIDKMVCIHECANGLIKEESLYHYNDDTLGGYNVYMQGKYGQFMKMIADNLDTNYVDVRYKNVVKTVKYHHNESKYDNDYDMEIICKGDYVYKAKHVIICIPIGCLQARSIEFVPNLKDTFWNSIDNGFGITNCDKLILQFEGQFPIRNNVTTINIINKQCDYKIYESIPGENQYYGFGFRIGADYFKHRAKYNIWSIFISPHYWAKRMNATDINDDIILIETIKIFKDMFGCNDNDENSMNFPRLKRHHITRWNMDEYCRGCWCFMKKGGNGGNDCENILNGHNIFDVESDEIDNNLNKKLQFAGEYTSADGIGTVYAAFSSGMVSANNILNLVQ